MYGTIYKVALRNDLTVISLTQRLCLVKYTNTLLESVLDENVKNSTTSTEFLSPETDGLIQ